MARSSKKARLARANKSRKEGQLMTGGSFVITFLSQLTAKDITANQAAFSAYTPTDKAKFLANTVVGRITGINIFNDMPQVPQTINPSGVINKYTGLGLGAIIYKKVPFLPFKNIVGHLGEGSLAGGIFGGLFDAPNNSNVSDNQSYASQAAYMNSSNKAGGRDILS